MVVPTGYEVLIGGSGMMRPTGGWSRAYGPDAGPDEGGGGASKG